MKTNLLKIFSFILVFLICLPLVVACNNSSTDESDSANTDVC